MNRLAIPIITAVIVATPASAAGLDNIPPAVMQAENFASGLVKEVQYVPITYQGWQSVEEFEDMFKGAAHPMTSKACLATVKNIQEYAITQGYPVSLAFIQHGVYYGHVVSSNLADHAGLLVDIQGTWYFVDVYPWRMTRLFSEVKG